MPPGPAPRARPRASRQAFPAGRGDEQDTLISPVRQGRLANALALRALHSPFEGTEKGNGAPGAVSPDREAERWLTT